MKMKQKDKKKNNRERLVELNLELVRQFLIDAIRKPNRLAPIPDGSTLILYPVAVPRGKAA